MTELLDDYRKAAFPLEVKWGKYGTVRLLAGFENGVVGVTYCQKLEEDGRVIETFSQALTWDGNGQYAGGQYPDMNLPLPPAKMHKSILAMEDEARTIRERLDANPEAPDEWRKPDERRLEAIEKKITDLVTGQPS